MRCGLNEVGSKLEAGLKVVPKYFVRSRLWTLASAFLAALATACASGGPGINPPPRGALEWFFVDSFTGQVGGFSAASGKLGPLPGSSLNFNTNSSLVLFSLAVDPKGMFVAGIRLDAPTMGTLQIANIASGGAVSLTQLTAPVANPFRMAISSQGVLAVSDGLSTIQFFSVQNNALVKGPVAQTSVSPQDLDFRADGKVLYVLNGGSAISVFSVASDLSLQLIENISLPLAPGQLFGSAVRFRLSASGNKIAAATLDGWVYVGDVSATDGTVSGFTEIQAAQNANLQEVALDPSGQNVYTSDQDNGGIYEFAAMRGALMPLAGSPIPTLPGPMGMEFNSAGDRMYFVLGVAFPQGQILTFSRDLTTGKLTATSDSVSAGEIFANRIVRVAAH